MAIDVTDAAFQAWLRDQPRDTQADLNIFWRHEVVRHPFIRQNPATADQLKRTMLVNYAIDNYGYEPAR